LRWSRRVFSGRGCAVGKKLKVWHSIVAIPLEHAIRGQYGPGTIEGKKVVGYRQEDRVSSESGTETFAEVRLEIGKLALGRGPVLFADR